MLVVFLLIFLFPNGNCHTIFTNDESNNNLISCVTNIVEKYYEGQITYVDINSVDNEILKAINSLSTFLITSRTTNKRLAVPNLGYVIFADNATDFADNFHNLDKEAMWKPAMRFTIIIKTLEENNLNDIFNELLKLHVTNAIVINGTEDGDIYTYNPFENYACGNYYERMIHFGKCLNSTATNLFPDKFVTGLRRCRIRAVTPHAPPYTIDPKRNKDVYNMGLEQYAFGILSDLEEFEVNYTFTDIVEEVSTFDMNMKADGSFELIQSNQSDVLFGFTILTHTRADALDILYKHISFFDEFTVVVRKAGNIPVWKTMYLGFNTTVWILLTLAFVSSAIFFLKFLRVKDKTNILLKMWDSLLLHGYNVRCKATIKFVLIVWIWFTFLVNSFYQSSLMSLTTHPMKAYQVASEDGLKAYSYKTCLSPGIRQFLEKFAKVSYKDYDDHCIGVIQGMEIVSKLEDRFTVVPLSIYEYNKFLFLHKDGTPRTYHFRKPLNKIIYGTFLYKGFPLIERLDLITLRMREAGLMDKYMKYLYYQRKFKIIPVKDRKARMIVPWHLLGFGSGIATIIFILEILGKYDSPNKSTSV